MAGKERPAGHAAEAPLSAGSVEEPVNREPPVEELLRNFITKDIAYDRNHGPIPVIDSDSHCIHVEGATPNALSLSVQDLRTSFPQHEVTCALQCAGNRRHTMRTQLKEVDGIDWGDAAVMNCHWRGPRLRDVLLRAGVEQAGSTGHAAFACHQTKTQNDDWYGASIDLERALSEDGEVILALERNSKPLTPNHGAPVRVIVPGVAGARSVKWLDRITVQTTESTNFYQRRDYKVLPEEVENAEQAQSYWDSIPAMQDMPVNSVIVWPQSGAQVHADTQGAVEVCGYALPQGMQGPVIKVEVSVDEQKTWTEATLGGEQTKWSWALWRVKVNIEKGKGRRFYCRATDRGGNTQPEKPAWNLRGVGYDGYGQSQDVEVL